MAQFDKKEQLSLVVDEIGEGADTAGLLAVEIAARFGPRDEKPLALALRDTGGALVAGLNGASHWRWLYVRHLWVSTDARGRGLGRRLIDEAARIARLRDCVGIYVDTFDPRAAAFYERCGFTHAGEIADFPPGHRRIFLSRSLSSLGPRDSG